MEITIPTWFLIVVSIYLILNSISVLLDFYIKFLKSKIEKLKAHARVAALTNIDQLNK